MSNEFASKCPQCNGFILGCYCDDCGKMFPELKDAHKKMKQELDKKKKEKVRQESQFMENFDKTAWKIALQVLSTRESVTVKELVDLMIDEGMMNDFRVIQASDSAKIKNEYQSWACHRAIGLAKFWDRNGWAFFGTDQVQGHPYRIYLPKEKEKFDEMKKFYESTAEWSVSKIMKKKKEKND